MSDTKILFVVRDGSAVDAILVPASAEVAKDGSSAHWDDMVFPAPNGATFVDQDGAAIGWALKKGVLTAPPAPPEPPLSAPSTVSSAQAKIQLLRTPGSADGKTLLDDVRAAVEAAGGEVEIWFTDARSWDRANPYVAQLGKSLKLKAADIDALFSAAAQIAA
jgi:hypothetical protein